MATPDDIIRAIRAEAETQEAWANLSDDTIEWTVHDAIAQALDGVAGRVAEYEELDRREADDD